MDDEVLQELKRISALLRIGFSNEIEKVRLTLAKDGLTSAVLETLQESEIPMSASRILEAVEARGLKPGARTVRRRLGTLVEDGFLSRVGQGNATEYKSSGLISI